MITTRVLSNPPIMIIRNILNLIELTKLISLLIILFSSIKFLAWADYRFMAVGLVSFHQF